MSPRSTHHAENRPPEEYKSFFLDNARTAKLATVRKDGRPHVAPIWLDLDGDVFVFTAGTSRSKPPTSGGILGSANV